MTRARGLRIVAAAIVLLAVGGTTGALASAALTVRITSAPPSTSASAGATFGWVANETAAVHLLARRRPSGACSSPKTYSGLGEGLHTFLVTATNKDRAGNTLHGPGHAPLDRRSARRTPPPPPPSKTANLLVTVEGGGEVSSEPAGINCPGDCEQSFPVGTKVTLSPNAEPGSRFAGWHGACDGGGACAPAVSATTLVLALFTALGPEPHLYRGDREGDGLSNAKDACPNSPRGFKPLLAGCTAIDLLNGADGLVADVDDALDFARQKTLGVKGLKVVGRDLSAVMDLIEQSGIDISDGDPCGGAATIGKGARLLTKANAAFAAVQKQLAKQPPPNGEGDADETDLQLAGLHYRQGLLGQAAGKVAKLQRAYAAICGDLGEKVTLVGRVGKTKDADGLIELKSRPAHLPGRRGLRPRRHLGRRTGESRHPQDRLGAVGRAVRRRARQGPRNGPPDAVRLAPDRAGAGIRQAESDPAQPQGLPVQRCAPPRSRDARGGVTEVRERKERPLQPGDRDVEQRTRVFGRRGPRLQRSARAPAGRRQCDPVVDPGIRAVSGQQLSASDLVEPDRVASSSHDDVGGQELPLSGPDDLDDQVQGPCPRPRRLRPCRVREDDLPAREQRAPDHQGRGDLPASLHDPAFEGDLRGRGLQAGWLARAARRRSS